MQAKSGGINSEPFTGKLIGVPLSLTLAKNHRRTKGNKQMCSSKDDTREIMQLWYAAQLCYSLVPKNIDSADMVKTVALWSVECENSDDFYTKPLFTFSCHLASCAIRLYSIDEKKDYQRYKDYQNWWKDVKNKRAFSDAELSCVIHCILRNVVAHNEKQGERTRNYNEIKNYYFGLTFYDLYNGMKDVINSIAQELNRDGIMVISFA